LFELIEKMRSLEEQDGFNRIDIKLRIFISTNYFEMLAYERQGKFDQALAMIEPVKQQLATYGDKVTKEDEVLFEHLFANIYFGAQHYRDALRQLNNVLNDNETNLRQDIYSFSKLFNLVIHYELNNYDLLDYLVKSTERFYTKRKKAADHGYEFEVTFLKSFKKLVKTNRNLSRSVDVFKEMLEDLKLLLADQNERVALEYFDYLSWVESKLQGIAYGEYKRKHATKPSLA